MARYKKVTFVGGCARSVTGGDQAGINNSAYCDTEYWSHTTDSDNVKRLTCQKAFTARLIFFQGTRGGSSVQARRCVYQLFEDDTTEDFLETTAGNQLFTTVVRRFEVGDVIRCWQEVVNHAQETVGILFILAVD